MEKSCNGLPEPAKRNRLTLGERKLRFEQQRDKADRAIKLLEREAKKEQRKADTRLKIQIGAECMQQLGIKSVADVELMQLAVQVGTEFMQQFDMVNAENYKIGILNLRRLFDAKLQSQREGQQKSAEQISQPELKASL